MIRVQPRPEYAAFDADVRVPGRSFLQTNPNPSSRDFDGHNYWRHAKGELRDAYVHCAYTSLRPHGSDVSVDHFLPKTRHPQLAYEWDNYRLARPKLNQNKADSEAVVDPFDVCEGWFVLDVPSCLVFPADNLEPQTYAEVSSSIGLLRLNSNELAEERSRWLVALAEGRLSLDYVRKQYPFLALEVERQGVEGQLRTLFSLE
ncbi:hypothetical protein [Candidatus Palauibacter sp.]|uniref:hypothetical protein n=1 Tax=Candidatus Palauibacter sp. TaxID=3101350 RepID=UPI003AF1FFE5